MVKKPKSEERWRQGRIALRVHEDLREALDGIAAFQHRSISNLVELLLLNYVVDNTHNRWSPKGQRMDRPKLLSIRDGKK